MAFVKFVLLAVWVLCVPLTVRAQASAGDLSRNAEAVARGERGLEAFRNGDFVAAYELFQQAETLAHSPVFLLFMARARERQGAWAEALDLYARIAREPSGRGASEAWVSAIEQAKREAEELRARLAQEAAAREHAARSEASRVTSGPRVSRAAAFAAGAIGVAGVVLGATSGIVAWVELEELRARCSPRGCDRSDRAKLERIKTWSRVSDVGFVIGGTGLLTSAVFLWVVPAVSATPGIPVDAGLSAQVRF